MARICHAPRPLQMEHFLVNHQVYSARPCLLQNLLPALSRLKRAIRGPVTACGQCAYGRQRMLSHFVLSALAIAGWCS